MNIINYLMHTLGIGLLHVKYESFIISKRAQWL